MFMVVQFYIQLKDDLAEHKPGIKVLSIKLVIFFCFWQTVSAQYPLDIGEQWLTFTPQMVISFLASAHGPLQPTPKLSYQDIKIGIPSVILIIEMSLFSILHIFAYPWKPYSLKHSATDPLETGYTADAKHYKGGPMGIKAIADAFNPWDIVKASARGFRWMFVGVRQRHMDVSYQPAAAKLGGQDTGYMGPTTYAMAGDATSGSVSSSNHGRRGRAATAEDDRAGLLNNVQHPAGASPFRAVTNDEFDAGDDGNIDLGVPRRPVQSSGSSPWAADWKPSEFDEEEDFHPGMGPPPGTDMVVGRSGDVHPVHRGQAPSVPPGQGWNHWGGVESPSPPGQSSRGFDYR